MFCGRCQLFWDGAFEKAHVPEDIGRPEDIVWAPHELVLHTSLRELKKSSDHRCRICRLIYHLPTKYEYAELLNEDSEKIRIVLSLHALHGPLPILQAEFREGSSNDVRIPKRLIASCTGSPATEREAVEAFTAMLDEAVESENDHTGSDGALQLASYWIKTCVDTHEQCRSRNSLRSAYFMPTRVLDVSNNQVRLVVSGSEVEEPARERSYVALSHCWGSTPIIRTLKSNFEQHMEAILWETLSKTFREAVHTTRKLGFRYIWIDSLCIIQDDNNDWAAEAATMCDVYQNAALTIAAAHATGGDIGCFAKRDGLLILPFYVDFSSRTNSAMVAKLHFTTYGRAEMKELGGGDPALYGRAWVLQEQLLSPRLLIFDGTQLKWECITMHGSEGTPTSGATRYSDAHKLVRSAIMGGHDFFRDIGSNETRTQLWCQIVEDYVHRGMTKPSDRLAALAGIGQALSRHSKHDYVAGLWSINFFTGLLWSLPHLKEILMSAKTDYDVENNSHIRFKKHIAPSWSWASVTAPVRYDVYAPAQVDRVCEVYDVQVSGSALSQMGRATIHGHVRKGYINAIYPYTIREAVTKLPNMTAPPTPQPRNRSGLENATFRKRCFRPSEFFLFSEQDPDPNLSLGTDRLRNGGPYRFVRGTFRPDEIIDPKQEITFIAISQEHYDETSERLYPISYLEHAPVRVHALALVPTKDRRGTYRRVGLAIWGDCAWYGYFCGRKNTPRSRITAWWEWSLGGRYIGEYFWIEAYRRWCWDDLELHKPTKRVGGDGEDGRWKHQHWYQGGQLPDRRMYKKGIKVQEMTVVIV